MSGAADLKNNIVLIGMPGAGKSTVGLLLSRRTGYGFADTDEMIKSSDGRAPKDIVLEEGLDGFLEIQKKVVMSAVFKQCIVSTGGGVVKSDELMQYLRSVGNIIYLKYDFETLNTRLAPGRRLARADGQTFRQVFDERGPLYRAYADRVIECTGKTKEEIVQEIMTDG